MTNIELPAYRIIVPNEVFGRKAKPLNYPTLGKVQATQITRLTRFKVPTQDEVIDFIRTSAKGIDHYSLGKEKPSEDSPDATYFLKLLPASEVKDIARGKKDSLQYLRNHYPESNLQSGRSYVEAISGIVPNQILDSARELLKEEGGEIYERAIERVGVQEWNLRMRLQDNGAFPNSLELEYLLDRGVRESDVFSARGDFEEYQTVTNQVRLLYNALSSPAIIAQIGDMSYNLLEQKATLTVRETAKCISAEGAIGGLVGIIGQVLEGLSEQEQQKPKKPFGYGGDCSLN